MDIIELPIPIEDGDIRDLKRTFTDAFAVAPPDDFLARLSEKDSLSVLTAREGTSTVGFKGALKASSLAGSAVWLSLTGELELLGRC